jgi:hypothetical protein
MPKKSQINEYIDPGSEFLLVDGPKASSPAGELTFRWWIMFSISPCPYCARFLEFSLSVG